MHKLDLSACTIEQSGTDHLIPWIQEEAFVWKDLYTFVFQGGDFLLGVTVGILSVHDFL